MAEAREGAYPLGMDGEQPLPAARRAFRFGAYLVFPALTISGGALLARVDSAGGIAAACGLLAAAALTLVWLARLCRRCGDRLAPRLLSLLALPAAVTTALALRSSHRTEQYLALAMIGAAAVVFSLAWRLTRSGAPRVAAPAPVSGRREEAKR